MIISNIKIEDKLKNISFENGKITRIFEGITESDYNATGNRLIPGLIDIHAHGCVGFDTMDGSFKEMCKFLANNGTTSWLPTTMTDPMEEITSLTRSDTKTNGAQILGFHLEGPFISKKYKGAQNADYIALPSLDIINNATNVIMVTVAPELKGSLDFIKNAGCIVSLGHTDCSYDEACEAFDSGARCVTHLFNAMPPLHHRNPSLIGAALERREYCQIICDGIHVDKTVFMLSYRLLGSDRMILISDSMRATGLDDGEYEFGGQTVCVADGIARTQDGKLAGSTSTLMQCVKQAVLFGTPFDDAVKMATQNPADLLEIKKGRIEEGYDADLLVVDDDLNILKTIINGKFYESE